MFGNATRKIVKIYDEATFYLFQPLLISITRFYNLKKQKKKY